MIFMWCQDEIEQMEVRQQVAREQAMAPKKLAGLAALQVKLDGSFEDAMRRLGEAPGRLGATENHGET